MMNGIIELDSEAGKEIGFLSSKFGGYLWKQDGAIIVSFIVSKSKGNFRRLVERIRSLGFAVKVPTPLGRMQDIVLKNGYRHTIEHDKNMGENVEVWVLEPPVGRKY